MINHDQARNVRQDFAHMAQRLIAQSAIRETQGERRLAVAVIGACVKDLQSPSTATRHRRSAQRALRRDEYGWLARLGLKPLTFDQIRDLAQRPVVVSTPLPLDMEAGSDQDSSL